MVRETGFTSPLRLFSENPVEVLQRLRDGSIDYLGGAEDQFTDLHVLYALKSGLIDECARGFPDPRYEGSEVAKDDDGEVFRGYKLALLSSLIDTGRVIVRMGWDSARPADLTVARPLLEGETPLGAGDTLLHDRGLNDGPRISCLK